MGIWSACPLFEELHVRLKTQLGRGVAQKSACEKFGQNRNFCGLRSDRYAAWINKALSDMRALALRLSPELSESVKSRFAKKETKSGETAVLMSHESTP
jgi:hypothetical protein